MVASLAEYLNRHFRTHFYHFVHGIGIVSLLLTVCHILVFVNTNSENYETIAFKEARLAQLNITFHETLDCNDIGNLPILRKLGQGKHKIAYEVLLSNGEHAVAKRCKDHECFRYNLLKLEVDNMKRLSRLGVNGIVKVLGECYLPPTTKQTKDFSAGYTTIVEMGIPLTRSWFEFVGLHGCLRQYFTPADLHDLRKLARDYTSADTLLAIPGTGHTDNAFPGQYVMTKGGLRHVDADMTYDCTSATISCPDAYEAKLEINCKVLLGGLAMQTAYNCTEAYSRQQTIKFPDQHMDVQAARRKCRLWNRLWPQY